MTDVHDPATRSFNMSRIRAKDTKPELLVRKFLHSEGFRYRLHDKSLPGKPDLVFARYKKVLFVHGCFWHAHERCKYFVLPKTRTEWWKEKLYGNRRRDQMNEAKLRSMGWKVLKVFECQLKPEKQIDTLRKLSSKLDNVVELAVR